MFFEGSEKKVEIVFNPNTQSLRSGAIDWNAVVAQAKATVLSSISNDQCTAYLLSESSLFVYDHRLIMITCGTTSLVNAILKVFETMRVDDVQLLAYERKNELMPHQQPSDFHQDVMAIRNILPGEQAGELMRLGKIEGNHVLLFHYQKDPAAEHLDLTMEILMHGLDPSTLPLFEKSLVTTEDLHTQTGLDRLIPGFEVDAYIFDPSGYSMNAIKGGEYYTMHVTPQADCSFASFETNHLFKEDLGPTVESVIDVFKPQSFIIMLYHTHDVNLYHPFQFKRESEEIHSVGLDYRVHFANCVREIEGDQLAPPEAPAPEPVEKGYLMDEQKKPLLTNTWIGENHADILLQQYRVKNTLFTNKSKYQIVEVAETYGHGKVLFLDGCVMISERDEFVYHDMIAHVPMFLHPGAERVLVIGGGDGGTVREVLRHPGVKHVDLVEIDGMVVDVCKQFFPQTSNCLNDSRVDVRIEDGVAFVADCEQRYDVILVDSTDPIGPAEPLFGETFYNNVFQALTDKGIVVVQGESPFYNPMMQASIAENLGKSFSVVRPYNYSNLTYPGGLWTFMYASKGIHPLKDFEPGRVASLGMKYAYYSAEVHQAAFSLPAFQKEALSPYFKN